MRAAFIIPCLNEESSIGRVVADCRAALPTADVVVFDNASTDGTARAARRAGARVVHSPARGKGNVLRHAFRELHYDYLIMIDGDGTYPVDQTPRLLALAESTGADMVCGARLALGKPEAFRPLHYLGNRVFTAFVRWTLRRPVEDLLTGFRVFSRRFASEVTLESTGFEVETELTIRAVKEGWRMIETSVPYAERAAGGRSKLRTFRDGFLIIRTMLRLILRRGPTRAISGDESAAA